ncbi:cobaltochelatase subunit CobN [Methanomethylovorans sp.]|uniref:cobaltochelatase subunit CobN n=1 Tax=Methanomethylovorans sp. TaxID=2758717 RepID=UPI00261096CA|nr:cobaltochelatase subunit CobN [Methanomethylovorans sp.]
MKTRMKNVQKNVVSGLLATVLCVTILLLPTVSAAPFSTATTGSMESMIYLSNTTSDADGNFIFMDITDGDYVLASVIYSSAMGGMWLTNVTEVSIMNGLAVTDLNLSMRKNDDIDHEEILSAFQTTTISGKTTSKTGESRADVDIVLVLEDGSFYAHSTSDQYGNFIFTGVPDGSYTLRSVIYSTAMNGMWLTNITSLTVQDGLEVTDLNLSMRKNDDVDHEAILALLESASMLDTATISGKTTSKSGEGRAGVDLFLFRKTYAASASGTSNEPHLNIAIITGYSSHDAQLASFVSRINSNPDLNITASYYLPDKLSGNEDLSQMDIIYINMFTKTAYRLQETVDTAIANGCVVIGYNTYLNENIPFIPSRFNDNEAAFKSHLQKYWLNGASNDENFDQLIFYLASEYYNRTDLNVQEPIGIPERAIYHPSMADGSMFLFTDNSDEYFQWYANRTDGHSFDANAPTVGIAFYKSYYPLNMEPVEKLIEGFEARGINVVACYGSSTSPIDGFLNHSADTKVDVVISFLYRGNHFDIDELNVPVINGVLNGYMDLDEWKSTPTPIPVQYMLRLYGPETTGLIDPIMIAAKKNDTVSDTEVYVSEASQVEWLIERAMAQAKLAEKDESEKKVAIIYYNHGAGKGNIGASYLQVIPSICNLLNGMYDAGYNVDTNMIPNETELLELIVHQGTNIGSWAPGELEKLVDNGKVELVPQSTYETWFNALPEDRRHEVISFWGEAPGNIMVYTANDGKKYIVIPKIEIGEHIILAPQPTRGWLEDNDILYHDTELPPHHQYIAFYLWLQNEYEVDVMVNMGRHGTVEWLPGKDFCLLNEEWPAIMAGNIPVIYPYVMDGVGEGMQAKRRGNAIIIDHLIPPVISAGLYGNYSTLSSKITAYHTSVTESESLKQAHLQEIIDLVVDLGIDEQVNMSLSQNTETIDAFLDEVDDVLSDLKGQSMPYGLHILGKALQGDKLVRMVNSMLGNHFSTQVSIYNTSENASIDLLSKVILENMSFSEAQTQILGTSSADIDVQLNTALNYTELLLESDNEIQQILRAMNGEYIKANIGGDPVLRPETLPSGRNFYSFDEQLLPTKQAWEEGKSLVDQWLSKYYTENGYYPTKVSYILWAGESARHEGIMESQIFYLLGVEPVWENANKVAGIRVMNSSELGRPRIDVITQISGLYRDTFPMKVKLIDQAVRLAYEQDEQDNYVRENTNALQLSLNDSILDGDISLDIALFRVFGPADGAYGTGMANAVSASNTWNNSTELAELYISRMSYVYGENIWGQTVTDYIEQQTGHGTNIDSSLLFASNLEGTRSIFHSRSSNTYGSIDIDDFYQYMGGLYNAITYISATSPDTFVVNLQDLDDLKIESLQKYIANELYARYFNPTWISGMQEHGFEGAKEMGNFLENLWGWEALNPELISDDVWNKVYMTYAGNNELSEWIKINNAYEYQSMTGRLLETARKGNWNPSEETLNSLVKEYTETVVENGVTCCHHTCGNPLLDDFVQGIMSVPGVVDERTAMQYKQIMEEATNEPEKEITYRRSGSSGSSSSKKQNANEVMAINSNQTVELQAGAGADLSQQASKTPKSTPDNYVEGYEMKKEVIAQPENSNKFSGSDIVIFLLVAGAVGAVFLGFRRKRDM